MYLIIDFLKNQFFFYTFALLISKLRWGNKDLTALPLHPPSLGFTPVMATTMVAAGPVCTICLDGDSAPPPIQRGCACRGEQGFVHVECNVKAAVHRQPGFHSGWYSCTICNQHFTGEMEVGLARALIARMEGTHAEDPDFLAAQASLHCTAVIHLPGVVCSVLSLQ